MHDVQASPSVRRFPIESGLLLFAPTSNRLFAFNDTARQVWDLIAAGRSYEDVVGEFAAWWGIPASHARDDVSSILAQWRDLGLLLDGEGAAEPPEVKQSAAACRSDASPPQSITEWTCTIRGKAIGFAVAGRAAPAMHPLFSHLETPGVTPQVRFEINTAASGELLLRVDGVERIRTPDTGELAGAVYQSVLEHIHPGVAWLALIHGAALARNGKGIALPGPSGSGKSTLAAGLMHAGFDYLSDDLIALSAPDGGIQPWPLPLSIKPGSIDVVAARHPGLEQAAPYRTKGLDARLLVPPQDVWDAEPVPLRCLVFPRFDAAAAAALQRISTFDAIARLLSDRIWLGYPVTEARVTEFLAWLDDVPAYTVAYGNLDDGVRLVRSLLD